MYKTIKRIRKNAIICKQRFYEVFLSNNIPHPLIPPGTLHSDFSSALYPTRSVSVSLCLPDLVDLPTLVLVLLSRVSRLRSYIVVATFDVVRILCGAKRRAASATLPKCATAGGMTSTILALWNLGIIQSCV